MGLLHRGATRRTKASVFTTVVALFAFQVLAVIGAGIASAVTQCTYNPATDTINVTIDPGASAGLAVEGTGAEDLDTESPAGAILFGVGNPPDFQALALSTQCGSADNTNVVSIVVLGSPSNEEFFTIQDNPGFNPAIVWAVDLGGQGAAQFDGLVINGGSGDDEVVVTNTTFTVNGGGGELLGVEDFYLTGGDGDDVLDASGVGPGPALGVANGGAGDDWIAPGTFAGDGDPVIDASFAPLDGAAGEDTLSYGTRTTCIAINSPANEAGNDANCDGDSGDAGDEGDNIVAASFEVMESGSGNDHLVGVTGVDNTFIPGDGDDDIDGIDASSDALDFSTASAAVTIDPALGTATGQGTDTFSEIDGFAGSAFDDVLIWDGTAPTAGFAGGDGVDTVDASADTSAGVAINLETLSDFFGTTVDSNENAIGGTGNDTLTGNDLRNELTGGEGNDTLSGAGGNDRMLGGLGNDNYNGGAGADTVSFAGSPNRIIADVSLGFASGEGDDSLGFIEIVVGSDHNDNITGGQIGGGSFNFRLRGRGGNDRLTGSDSNDLLNGGRGNDRMRGGGGDDTIRGGPGRKDRAWGGPGVDFCTGTERERGCEG